mmetsp:Transcript_10082/g.25119  ORF Transcript_10082/g.25119 Transcript_10082/m.25119 type:complete len:228 (-) Transcript_10082:95-778(-)
MSTSFGLKRMSTVFAAVSSSSWTSLCTALTSVAPGATSSSAAMSSAIFARGIEPVTELGGSCQFFATYAEVPSSGKRICILGRSLNETPSPSEPGRRGASSAESCGRKGCRKVLVRESSPYVSSPADVSNSMTSRSVPSASASVTAPDALRSESSKLSGSGLASPRGTTGAAAAFFSSLGNGSSSSCIAPFCISRQIRALPSSKSPPSPPLCSPAAQTDSGCVRVRR